MIKIKSTLNNIDMFLLNLAEGKNTKAAPIANSNTLEGSK